MKIPFITKTETREERLEKNKELTDKADMLQREKWKLLRIQRPQDQIEVLIEDYDARYVDWEYIYGNGWTSRVTDVCYTFQQIERKQIPIASNIWTCHCSSKFQFIHTHYTKVCLRCMAIYDKKEYTKRLPDIREILPGWRKFVELPKYVKG